MFKTKYPVLYGMLPMLLPDSQLDVEQLKGMFARAKLANPDLRKEISLASRDPSVSWQDLLNDPKLGDPFLAESEEEARDYVLLVFGE